MFAPEEPCLHDLVLQHTLPAFLLQRLGRGTSGVIFFSKRADANPSLTRQFRRKLIRKTYLALCEGELTEPRTIDAPIARVGTITFGVREHGKPAVTHVSPLASSKVGSIVASGSRPDRRTQSPCNWPPSGLPSSATGRT